MGEWGVDAGSAGWGGPGWGAKTWKSLALLVPSGNSFQVTLFQEEAFSIAGLGRGQQELNAGPRPGRQGLWTALRMEPPAPAKPPSPGSSPEKVCLSTGLRIPGGLRVPHLGLVQHSPGLGNEFPLRPREARLEICGGLEFCGAAAEPPYTQCLG